MPIYEYQCQQCGAHFDFQGFLINRFQKTWAELVINFLGRANNAINFLFINKAIAIVVAWEAL